MTSPGQVMTARWQAKQAVWSHIIPAAAVVLLAVVAVAAVRSTGGSPNPLNHLGYPPIILAAYLYGWRGAVLSAALTSFLLGPLGSLAGLPGGNEGPEAWAIRASMFLMVGGVTGMLFARMRHALDGWRSSALEVSERQRDGMVALARGAEAKDNATGEHILGVQAAAESLAREVGLVEAKVSAIGWAAMLHDVGKLHVPDRILLKPGPLDEAEWEIMRQHSAWGAEILAQGHGFELARGIARWHHENFDGSGYPDGLRGNAIALEARIVRIADAFDAMTEDRPYRQAHSIEWALEEIERCAGSQFDPELARLFVNLMGGSRRSLI
jgi:putative nucleotidyltransferase with HDIG domain